MNEQPRLAFRNLKKIIVGLLSLQGFPCYARCCYNNNDNNTHSTLIDPEFNRVSIERLLPEQIDIFHQNLSCYEAFLEVSWQIRNVHHYVGIMKSRKITLGHSEFQHISIPEVQYAIVCDCNIPLERHYC